MALEYFTVTGNFLSLSGQEIWDASQQSPQAHPATGTVTFKPLFRNGEAAKTDSAVVALQSVQAVVKDGVLSRNGEVGCKLVANTAELNLEELYYRVAFFNVRAINGEEILLNEFDFLAPTSASTLDLAAIIPTPGSPATGRVASAKVPESAGDTGLAGQVAVDSTHIYVCVAANTWKRAALSSW